MHDRPCNQLTTGRNRGLWCPSQSTKQRRSSLLPAGIQRKWATCVGFPKDTDCFRSTEDYAAADSTKPPSKYVKNFVSISLSYYDHDEYISNLIQNFKLSDYQSNLIMYFFVILNNIRLFFRNISSSHDQWIFSIEQLLLLVITHSSRCRRRRYVRRNRSFLFTYRASPMWPRISGSNMGVPRPFPLAQRRRWSRRVSAGTGTRNPLVEHALN